VPQGLPDDELIARLGAMATDFLVAFGIASIKLATVHQLGAPILALALIGFVATVLAIWIAGRRLFHNYWFERSIFAYGWTIGVLATAVALLRSVDPEFRTKTLDHFALANLVIGPVEIGLIVLMPWLVVRNHMAVPGAALLALSAGCFLLSALTVGIFTASPTSLREGEVAS
jgi:ESS family glutamate:Na+ symporter